VELWAESSIDVICDALLELADKFVEAMMKVPGQEKAIRHIVERRVNEYRDSLNLPVNLS
jgi:hypothetical protein